MNTDLYSFSVRSIDGRPVTLGDYRGKVLLIVNVASQCGLTPQYAALESVYERFQEQGLEVLAFPANEFGAQEPGTNAEIQEFCTLKFGVRFPMFEKLVVKGEGQHPLYHFLTEAQPEARQAPGSDFEGKLRSHGITRARKNDVLWNFEKFLANRKGEIVMRFSPDVTPDSPLITAAIEAALKE